MTGLGAALTVFFSLMVLFGSRRWAVAGIWGAICYLTQGQSVDVAGLNFTAIRLVVLFGAIRVVSRGESAGLSLHPLDKALVAYALVLLAVYSMRSGTPEAFIYQSGVTFDILVTYAVFRCLVRDYEDVVNTVLMIGLVIVPLALFMLSESSTGRNVFSVFGGIPDSPVIRGGHYRCQGPFRSPITGGLLGATLVPLLAGLLFNRVRDRIVVVVGALAATAIVIASHSAAPLSAYITALIALACWRLRHRMRLVRFGIVGVLVLLHFVMKAPVWFIIARISDVIGGDGWHRAALIDQAVTHFNVWWLAGTSDTSQWMATVLPGSGNADLTNAYVAAGVSGGLLSMVLFILVMVRGFQGVGRAIKLAAAQAPEREWFLWAVGATLFTHVTTFISVQYFDQLQYAWYFQLAVVAAVTSVGNLADAQPERAEGSSVRRIGPVTGTTSPMPRHPLRVERPSP
jgi:hypothetical protein